MGEEEEEECHGEAQIRHLPRDQAFQSSHDSPVDGTFLLFFGPPKEEWGLCKRIDIGRFF